jgi:hypothetical protein
VQRPRRHNTDTVTAFSTHLFRLDFRVTSASRNKIRRRFGFLSAGGRARTMMKFNIAKAHPRRLQKLATTQTPSAKNHYMLLCGKEALSSNIDVDSHFMKFIAHFALQIQI